MDDKIVVLFGLVSGAESKGIPPGHICVVATLIQENKVICFEP